MNSDLRDTVIACLREFSPESAAIEITDASNPILDLGLDSLKGLELACEFSARLGVKIEAKDNPLIDYESSIPRVRKVGELVEHLSKLPKLTF